MENIKAFKSEISLNQSDLKSVALNTENSLRTVEPSTLLNAAQNGATFLRVASFDNGLRGQLKGKDDLKSKFFK